MDWNELWPIEVTVFGSSTEVIEDRPLKALSPIAVTGNAPMLAGITRSLGG